MPTATQEETVVLSRWLEGHGFINVTGTEEKVGDKKYPIECCSNKNCYNIKNGIFCVVDEVGDRWITISATKNSGGLRRNILLDLLLKEYSLESGTYVPHAYDNGEFLQNFSEFLRNFKR